MRQKRKVKAAVGPQDLLFITDESLRKNIRDSIESASFLLLIVNDTERKLQKALVAELYRIIILYAASILEAVLLHVYRRGKFNSTMPLYTHVHPLPKQYQSVSLGRVVVALQVDKEKQPRELMLDFLVRFLREQKAISSPLERGIVEAKNVRNTFHLSKSRTGVVCNAKAANAAFDILALTLVQAQKFLVKNTL